MGLCCTLSRERHKIRAKVKEYRIKPRVKLSDLECFERSPALDSKEGGYSANKSDKTCHTIIKNHHIKIAPVLSIIFDYFELEDLEVIAQVCKLF